MDSEDLENIKRKIAALKKLHDGAFQIHSYHGTGGAETLTGSGDMLFMSGAEQIRIQSPIDN